MIFNFLSVIFIFLSITIFSQNSRAILEVNYETRIINDSLNRDKATYIPYTLICNNEESFYYNVEAEKFFNSLFGDKKNDLKERDIIKTSLGNIPKYPKNKGSVYRLKDAIRTSLPVGKYIFNFEEPPLKWEILNETKYIKGYKCQLAKTQTDTNDIFFAWFTNDIPIQEGPFRFKGLSGLILEVYNKQRTIEIYATKINKSEDIINTINYGNDFIICKSKDDYLKARKNYLENPSIYNGDIRVFDSNGNNITRKINEAIGKVNVFLD